jgi:serine/threonine-protein kinase RsbW
MRFSDDPLKPFGQEILNISIPSELTFKTPLVFRACKELVQRGYLPEADTTRAEFCFEEALTNAMVHGNKLDYGKMVSLKLFADGERWGAIVADQGDGFGPEQLPRSDDPDFQFREKGRGMLLMDDYLDDLVYSRKGSALLMVRRRETAPAQTEGGAPAEDEDWESTEPVTFWKQEGIAFVQILARRIGDDNVGLIRETLKSAADETGLVVVDMARVEYLSSTMLGVFVAIANIIRLRKGDCRLAAVQPAVMGILKTVGLQKLLKFSADRETAVQELKATQ